MRILIVGGGIVGLTAALSLAKAGFRPVVCEAVPELKPLGVGINLLPHAMRELTELGLGEEVLSLGVAIESLTYFMQDGREVWKEPRGLAAGYDWPQVALDRGHFHMFLLQKVREALGSGAVRTGMKLDTFENRGESVVAHFENRIGNGTESIEADVLIGADGIHSSVRRALYPAEGRPIWNGISLFRSTSLVALDAFGPNMLWCGHADQKFIAYPIKIDTDRNEVTLNWVCDLRTAESGSIPHEEWNKAVPVSNLIESFGNWRWAQVDVPAIIAASSVCYEFPMVDRDPLPRWSFDRVTLAGDAAHPMYPVGSNGATQGIIDARALAYCVATLPDPTAALQEYEMLRREATNRIILGNRAKGPDVILEIARQRAPDANTELSDVLSVAERAEVASRYKHLAGFDPDVLKDRQSYSVHLTA